MQPEIASVATGTWEALLATCTGVATIASATVTVERHTEGRRDVWTFTGLPAAVDDAVAKKKRECPFASVISSRVLSTGHKVMELKDFGAD